MPLNSNKELKTYYTIKEVATLTGVPETTLRFWEKQFRELNPKKTPNGVRQYVSKDIETIRLIHHLVKEKGLTISAAKDRMRTTREPIVQSAEIVDRLQDIRARLQGMLDALG